MTDNSVQNSSEKFICSYCDYNTCRKSQYDRHLMTAKHIKTYNLLTNTDNSASVSSKKDYLCECGKNYKHRQSLYNHKKQCFPTETPIDKQTEPTNLSSLQQPTNELVMSLLNQNMELQKQIIELCKEKNTVINNNNTTTNNTNNFNLQFFLNEQCKDALNIMDFINQLKLNTTDLDMVGRLGYTEGISKLFIRGLKELDVFKRPVHCSDLKREVLYVKDKDSWEKDSDEKNKMKTAIKYIAAKNFKQINEWRAKNPESDDYDSQRHMDYHQIVIHSMGGSTKEEDEQHYNKIIRKVAKESVIDKSVGK